MMRRLGLLPAVAVLVWCSSAHAQSSVDVNIGFGSASDSASGAGLDNASSVNAFGGCNPRSGDPFCQATPSLSPFFLGFGGDIMLFKKLGAGFEANITPTRHDYGPLQYRELFYDVNGIYAPISNKRVQLRFEGGLGGARTSFAFTQNQCIGTAVCSNITQPVGNASHFQVHVGVGVSIFVTEHIFIRPQFDFHYVPGFTDQFSSNAVPAGTVWVGYNFGER